MLDGKADLNVQHDAGTTVLHWATWRVHDAVVSLLLGNTATLNYLYSLYQSRNVGRSSNRSAERRKYVVLEGYKWGYPGWAR